MRTCELLADVQFDPYLTIRPFGLDMCAAARNWTTKMTRTTDKRSPGLRRCVDWPPLLLCEISCILYGHLMPYQLILIKFIFFHFRGHVAVFCCISEE